ncbi:MAG: malto-oligosyltrehalose trehalohydrolase [Thermodesulfobacteriota bacterium]
MDGSRVRVGPEKTGDGWTFAVWAPLARSVDLDLPGPTQRTLAMRPGPGGCWTVAVPGLAEGCRYWFLLDGRLRRADPASHFQPEGVHGPSALVDHAAHAWGDAGFRPPPREDLVLYELHVGTFTPEGTLDAAIGRLDHLVRLGATAVELMPLAACPGARNWGYDGVFPFAVQAAYGGPAACKRFVDACHARGLAVVLDLVCNHLGPEGNYLRDFGPYFTAAYRTPWGEAVNFDGPGSDAVRNHFIQAALHWFERYHVDGLRLDATHAIHDERAGHFLAELSGAAEDWARRRGRRRPLLVAESDRNDPRLVLPTQAGGFGLDAVWADDFHHSLHSLLTGERHGFYADYGTLEHLADSACGGFARPGAFSPYRGHSYGAPAPGLPGSALVTSLQNHDQVGNRPLGERLGALVGFEALKAAAGLHLFLPSLPLLFMGEEWGEDRPFLYFVDHQDPDLLRAVRQGRRREFEALGMAGEPPDPAAEETFLASVLDWSKPGQGRHAAMLAFYAEALRLRRSLPGLAGDCRLGLRPVPVYGAGALLVLRRSGGSRAAGVFALSGAPARLDLASLLPPGPWSLVLDSAGPAFGGPGSGLPARPEDNLALPAYGAAWYHAPAGEVGA